MSASTNGFLVRWHVQLLHPFDISDVYHDWCDMYKYILYIYMHTYGIILYLKHLVSNNVGLIKAKKWTCHASSWEYTGMSYGRDYIYKYIFTYCIYIYTYVYSLAIHMF